MAERITLRQFREAGTEDWRLLGEGACAFFRAGSFAAGARLIQAITELDGLDAHHPDVDLRHDGVTVRLVTIEPPDFFGVSRRDLDLAREISALARKLDLAADPSMVQTIQVSIDAMVIPDVLPFWRAVLGYADRDNGGEDLMDPRGRGGPFWFQQMDQPRPQRNRVHIDVWVPIEQAEARIAAAVAAGGRLLTDEHAPEFWVLADPEGNEVCVATAG